MRLDPSTAHVQLNDFLSTVRSAGKYICTFCGVVTSNAIFLHLMSQELCKNSQHINDNRSWQIAGALPIVRFKMLSLDLLVWLKGGAVLWCFGLVSLAFCLLLWWWLLLSSVMCIRMSLLVGIVNNTAKSSRKCFLLLSLDQFLRCFWCHLFEQQFRSPNPSLLRKRTLIIRSKIFLMGHCNNENIISSEALLILARLHLKALCVWSPHNGQTKIPFLVALWCPDVSNRYQGSLTGQVGSNTVPMKSVLDQV